MSAGQDDKELLRYCPERELPDEIKKLPKDEVVCKFCGVSYLIHHEIKELQKRLKYLETCSSQLEECKIREKKLLQKWEEDKLIVASQNAEIEKSQNEITQLRSSLQQVNTRLQEKDHILTEKRMLLGNIKKQLLETLTTHRVYLNTMRTDISTAHNQVQLLSRNCNDIISMANSRLKQRLAENKVLSLEKISQLNTRCNQLCEDKEYSEAENKRLHNSMKQMESWYQQSEETNKNVISGLQGELNELNKQLMQSRSDLTSERLGREDLECKLRASKSDTSRLTKLLSDKTSRHAEEAERLQSRNSELEIKLQSSREELVKVKAEYGNVVKAHHNAKTASNEAFDVERRGKEQLLKERELMIESHQNRLQELQEHFKAEKQKLEAELMEKQKKNAVQLDQLQRSMESKLTTELSKVNQAAEKEQERLLNSKKAVIQQLENELKRMTEKHTTEVAELKEQLRVKQLENDAELTAHIHQVKELELKLKQLTEDASSRRSQQATVTAAVQVDTISKQLVSLQDQLQSQESHCAKLSEDLERSYKEVEHLQNTVHSECRERIELTEALEQAREKLLAYKVKDKMTVRPISASPVPPPQQGYHGNTLSSLNHSRQRIAQVTGRISKTDYRHTKSGRF